MSTEDQIPDELVEESTGSSEAAAADPVTGPEGVAVPTGGEPDGEIPGDGEVDMGAGTAPSAGPNDDLAFPDAPGPAPAQVDFRELVDALPGSDPQSLSVLFDLSLPVAIELGRTRMSVQDVLSLGRGSVVQLDRLAGEPVDVFVGDRRFAEGEVVVLGEQFGVRITRIIAGAIPNAPVAVAS